jgi:hypothetical protein
MASQGSTGVSRLSQMQMRFQQKQMQENAQKKTELYNNFDLNSSIGGGKVRQMFDERRRIVAGIDKSYLLDPIVTNKKTMPVQKMVTRTEQQKSMNTRVHHVPPLSNRSLSHDMNANPTSDIFDRSYPRNVLSNGDSFESKKLGSRTTNSRTVSKTSDENGNINVKPLAANNNGIRKASPATSISSQKSGVIQKSPAKSIKSGTSSASSSASSRKAPSAKSNNQRQDSISPVFDENEPVPDGLVRCPICKRNFADDRIEKHQVICQKTKTKKRKVFDSTKKRVQGTEAEIYVKKQFKPSGKTQTQAAPTSQSKPQSNWRAKHNEFIKTIREAKKVSAYLAKGGDIRDLPPPPPSENPDYIQCPHCQRKFNENAANRHIPICGEKAKLKPAAKVPSKPNVARFVGLKKR